MTGSDKYAMGHTKTETDRLRLQHDWLKSGMSDKLVLAPATLSEPNLRILDSGTADGLWLVDLSNALPASTKFIGTDVAAAMFPEEIPSNITLQVQDILQPWPQDFQNSFDFVNQRLVLAICGPEKAQEAVNALVNLAKPGGWIQLMECDHGRGIDENQPRKTESDALDKFGRLVMATLRAHGQHPRQGLKVKEWLEAAGAIDVKEVVLNIGVGKSAANDDIGRRSQGNILSVVRQLREANKGKDIPNLDFTDADYENLEAQLEEQLPAVGGTQRFHVTYGKRPLPN